jgi:phytoene desaturase
MMNYADMVLGTWYPEGGMFKIVDAMVSLAKELGVKFEFNAEVAKIEVAGKRVKHLITTNGRMVEADVVVGGADYHHLEQDLLEKPYRQYDEAYWSNRVMAPSSLIYYLGIKGRLQNVEHHNLFFDADFQKHSEEIYTTKQWPSDPLFYMSVPSVTDATIAPEGHENIFILIPIAPDLEDTEEMRDRYFTIVLQRIESMTGQSIKERIIYKRSYCIKDFKSDYHSFKGNAYGLANTLSQTAFLKPKMKSSKLENLYYTGQLTVPGPGIPPALISGQIVAREVMKKYA